MQKRDLAVVVLAAGKGTRMKSETAKVLHPLGGRPMLSHVLDRVAGLTPKKVVLVIGFQADAVRRLFSGEGIEFALQEQQLGTGHAVMQSESALEGFAGDVLILCGDMPLMKTETLQRLIEKHRADGAACTFLSLKTPEARDFGRVIRDAAGQVVRIVEHRDATPEEKTVDEYNSGVYCFQKEFLFKALCEITPENAQGEYYLTDTVQRLIQSGCSVEAVATPDDTEIFGINSLEDLKRAEALLATRS